MCSCSPVFRRSPRCSRGPLSSPSPPSHYRDPKQSVWMDPRPRRLQQQPANKDDYTVTELLQRCPQGILHVDSRRCKFVIGTGALGQNRTGQSETFLGTILTIGGQNPSHKAHRSHGHAVTQSHSHTVTGPSQICLLTNHFSARYFLQVEAVKPTTGSDAEGVALVGDLFVVRYRLLDQVARQILHWCETLTFT
eukprot:COSAG01_NODE_107_length_25964_cov_174.577576_10_plen_194_part_00